MVHDRGCTRSAGLELQPGVGAAVVGFLIAGYLALYQAGVFAAVWDPVFGAGSAVVLNSWVAKGAERYLGVSDAALGALGYLADAVAGLIGGTRRWRTMPWVVLLFGVFVGPLGAVSITLMILQPFVGGWCFLCLVTAFISVMMIGPAMDEVLASLQHLARDRTPLGSAAWVGQPLTSSARWRPWSAWSRRSRSPARSGG